MDAFWVNLQIGVCTLLVVSHLEDIKKELQQLNKKAGGVNE